MRPFRVRSAVNLADPLSGEKCFQSCRHAVLKVERRCLMWEKAAYDRYIGLAGMIRPPWHFRTWEGGGAGSERGGRGA